MEYDPVMCMMVEDAVKTNDAIPNGWKVTVEKNKVKHYVYSKAMSARGAEFEAKKEYPDATVLNVERYSVSDCKELTMDSEEYSKWLKKNETEASNENLVKYLVEVKGFTKENAKQFAKGRIHDAMNNAIKSCDSNFDEIKEVYNLLGQALQSSANANKWMNLVSEARGKLLTLAAKAKGS